MQKIGKYRLFLLLGIVLLFSSCKKTEEDFILGTWKRIKVEERIGSNPWQDVSMPCHEDDTESYSADGSWALYDGTYQCFAGSGVLNGTWSFAAENTKIIYTYDGIEGEYESTIVTLSESELVLTQSTGSISGAQIRYTYKK